MDKNKIITLWGILDLSAFVWYVGWRLFHGQIPFYHDIIKSAQISTSFGTSLGIFITVFSFILYLSLLFSGFYLIKRNKIGAILSYIQTPFRIIALIPPSMFFITWPLQYIFVNPKTITAMIAFAILLMLMESLKIYSVITWHRKMKIA